MAGEGPVFRTDVPKGLKYKEMIVVEGAMNISCCFWSSTMVHLANISPRCDGISEEKKVLPK
jgi:hypothetical protein